MFPFAAQYPCNCCISIMFVRCGTVGASSLTHCKCSFAAAAACLENSTPTCVHSAFSGFTIAHSFQWFYYCSRALISIFPSWEFRHSFFQEKKPCINIKYVQMLTNVVGSRLNFALVEWNFSGSLCPRREDPGKWMGESATVKGNW